MASPPTKVCPVCGTRYDAAAAFCQRDGARLTAEGAVDPFLGRILLGQFRIDQAIGAGGMGTVYRAHQLNLHRDVAVKILHPELTKNPDAVRRFHREARVATSLEHPNLVRVFLFGELPDQGGLYLVMEFLEGRSLAELMRQEGALSVARALHLSAQLCDAIGAAHDKGIVHRDIKPENIIVLPRHGDPDFVKVLDFGIARLLWDEQSHLTQSGVIFGTARYISPEGAAGEFTDARSDVYSMGVLIYQLLAGVTPFDAASPVSLLMKHVNEPAPELRSQAQGAAVPQPIADVVMRALAKNPDARYDTARDFGEALAAAAAACSIGLPRARYSLMPGDSLAGMAAPAPPVSSGETLGGVPGLRRRRWPAAAMAFALGAAAVVGGVYAIENKPAVESPIQSLEARVRAAIAEGHFDAPPGENVFELTAEMLQEEGGGDVAMALRREAAAELRQRGAQLAEEGDRPGARAEYERALRFVPYDAASQAALTALSESDAVEIAGVKVAPQEPQIAERVTFIGVLDQSDEVRGTPRFEVMSGRRVLRRVEATVASDHHYVATHSFRSSGTYRVRLVAEVAGGRREFDAEVVVRRRQRVVRRPRSPSMTSGSNSDLPPPAIDGRGGTPAPDPVPTMDDGIDWTIPDAPTMMNRGDTAPPPWTGSGSVI
ncbi:MAG: protein kinase [Myxococcota bacterium]